MDHAYSRAHSAMLTAIILGLQTLAWAAFAEPLPTAEPEAVGISSERLALIDRVASRAVEDGDIVGAVTLVARHSSVVHLHAEGWADREAERPMEVSNRFLIASMTKPIVTVAAMMLFEEGAFLLSDPVSDYLPEFADSYVLETSLDASKENPRLRPAKRPITIHHLLTHTSGISHPFIVSGVMRDLHLRAGVWQGLGPQDATIEEGVRRIASVPLLHDPGEAFTYGLSTDVLGRLLEVVSGTDLSTLLRIRVLDPLGMLDTAFYVDSGLGESFAVTYREDVPGELHRLDTDPVDRLDTDPVDAAAVSSPYEGPTTYFSGGAGLVSTASDYAKFCQMLLNGGELHGQRVLSPKTVRLMTMNHIRDLEGASWLHPSHRFGLGVMVAAHPSETHQLLSEGAYGWSGYFGTEFRVDPKEDLFYVVLTQTRSDASARFFRHLLPNLVYQAIISD